ncbi:DUF6460 domain-containing protein [Rhizobium sp. G187]|uniref:hypothetical protein n=1 Tax=unclassified Rhizobium TaxID=2613769 RepID=UPI0006B982D5|nr:hypothetical protein [Rhizobium sp. AAP43]KPF41601.1 hypothetical protein IP76_20340 [Rhizobium sp. AAP43]
MQTFIAAVLKMALASLLAGMFVGFFGITPRTVLEGAGLTAQDLHDGLVATFAWAAPRMLMGAIIILPAWFLTYMLMPPRG